MRKKEEREERGRRRGRRGEGGEGGEGGPARGKGRGVARERNDTEEYLQQHYILLPDSRLHYSKTFLPPPPPWHC